MISWNHRGVGGSDRPADPDRVDVRAFVEDAVAVLDDAGVEACPVMGWSIGVNTAFELAVEHPDRVTSVFAVAGVPGGTFASMGAPLQIPRIARRPLAIGVTTVLGRTGWALTPVTSRYPVGRRTAAVLRHSGFMMPSADPDVVQRSVRAFLATPVDWYMHLARAAARHDRVSLSRVRVPGVFVAGRYDVLASSHDMRACVSNGPPVTLLRAFVLVSPSQSAEELLALERGVATAPR